MTHALRPRVWLPVVPLLLLVMLLGSINLNADGLWFDEWWSMLNAGREPFYDPPLNPVQIWQRLVTEDPWQTPGYPLILSTWIGLVGPTEYAGRALSLLAALLVVALTYRAALAFTRDPVAAFGAAGILAGSSWLIYFSHELRVYTLYVFFNLLFLYAYWRMATRSRPGVGDAALVAVSGIIAVYLHPYALLMIGTVGLWHLLRLVRHGPRRGWLLASVALALPLLAFLPWVGVLWDVFAYTRRIERAEVTPGLFVRILSKVANSFSNAAPPLFLLIALFSFRRRASGMVWALLLALTTATLVAYGLARVSEPRYTMAIMPLLAMVGGLGVAALHSRRVPALVVLGVWTLPALLLMRDVRLGQEMQDTYPQPNREIAQVLTPYLTPDAAIINYLGVYLSPEQQVLALGRYLKREDLLMLEMETSRTQDEFIQRIDTAVARTNRAWLIYSPMFPGEEYALVQYILRDRGFYDCGTIANQPEMRISAYGRALPGTPVIRYGDQFQARVLGDIDQHADRLVAWVGFDGALPPDTYSVGVHLLDEQGALVAQQDMGLPSQKPACGLFTLPLTGLGPGRYTAALVIYEWRTGSRLPTQDGRDAVPLGSVERDA